MRNLEFWPDYDGTVISDEVGEPVDLDSLSLPDTLRIEVVSWVERYDDTRLPWEATHDDAWLAEGRRLFVALRDALAEQGIALVAGEDYW